MTKRGNRAMEVRYSEYTLFNNFDFGCKFYITKKFKPNMGKKKKILTKLN